MFIQSGKSAQNAYIARFNRMVRHEWLDEHLFGSFERAQETEQNGFGATMPKAEHGFGGLTPYQKLKMAA